MTETLSMRERIARAICSADGHKPDAQHCINGAQMLSPPQYYTAWHAYLPHADAVLEAIREPSRELAEVGRAGIWAAMDQYDHIEDGAEAAEFAWRRMIDAAIREGKDANG